MNYDRFINPFAARRTQSCLRHISRLYAYAPPGTIFFGGGLPNPKTFPFKKINVEISDQLNINLEGKILESALQYQPTPGFIPLVAELKAILTRYHGLDSKFWESRDLLITTGSMDGLNKAMTMLMEEGDPIIFQEPAYPGITSGFRPFNPRWITATEDENGVCPLKLRVALQAEGTPQEVRSKRSGVPKLMYLNPTGSNPTGKTLSTERRKEIYKIACEYDLLILEDDPYYFLRFEGECPTSFMSLDTEGRVIRFDSLSKVLSAGLRLGFVTAPKKLSERIERHLEVSTMHTSGLPQVLVYSLLNEWKEEGLNLHLQEIQHFYKSQRDKMIASAKRHLIGLAEWGIPQAGMFIWLKILGIDDSRDLVQNEGVANGIVLVSGHYCMINEDSPCPYVRISFSTTTQHEMDIGFSRLAEIIRNVHRKQSSDLNEANGFNGTNRIKSSNGVTTKFDLKFKS